MDNFEIGLGIYIDDYITWLPCTNIGSELIINYEIDQEAFNRDVENKLKLLSN